MWKTTKFLSDKAADKSRFREHSTDQTTEKKTENTIPVATKKATNFGLKLFYGMYKFSAISVTDTEVSSQI